MAGVQTIERAFSVLRALASTPMGVTELAEAVELPKSTVARLLYALESEGAVEQVEAAGEYRLGPGLADLTQVAGAERNLVAIARPILLALTERTGESAGLSTRDGSWVYYLDHAEGESDVQVRDWTGEWAPIHAVPSGLSILAHSPESNVDELLAGELEQCTPNTMCEPAAIRDRLAQVRSAGYVWGYEEFSAGINSVGAAAIDSDGVAFAAIHVHGPAYRFPNPDQAHDLGLLVADAARQLSEQISI